MAYLNKVMLIGNLGKDIEVRTLASGKVANFSLATSRRYKDKNGETKEETYWHTISAWGKVVDTLQQLHVGKGNTLYVEGALTNRSWTDQNGQKRYATEVRLDTFQLLTTKAQGNGQQAQQGASSYNQQTEQMYTQQQAAAEEDEDGLPF